MRLSTFAGVVGQAGYVVPTQTDFLVIAGGGSANAGGEPLSGGGGAGGYRTSWSGASGTEKSGRNSAVESAVAITEGVAYTITVGGSNGNSVFSNRTSTDGGQGTIGWDGTRAARNGGCGGGAGLGPAGQDDPGGSGTAGQGYDGGASSAADPAGGAGGGAGGNGGGARSSQRGGNGGAGLTSTITGSAVTRAGGGGGSGYGGVGGTGGAGGGGNGDGQHSATGTNGTANTGGGAGGGYQNKGGNSGGSGIVILRFLGSEPKTIGAGLTYTTSIVDGDTVMQFTSGTGTVTW